MRCEVTSITLPLTQVNYAIMDSVNPITMTQTYMPTLTPACSHTYTIIEEANAYSHMTHTDPYYTLNV